MSHLNELKSKLEILRAAFGPQDDHVRGCEYVIGTGNEQLALAQLEHLESLTADAKVLNHAKKEIIADMSKRTPIQCLRLGVTLVPGPTEPGIRPHKFAVSRELTYALESEDAATVYLPKGRTPYADGVIDALRSLLTKPPTLNDWTTHAERVAFESVKKGTK